jgi:hypothetical protein
MFIGAETFFRLVRNFRTCWFRGRYGCGKTALSVATALRMLDSGVSDCCVSNIPLAFGEQQLPPVPWRATILMDEGGLFWKTGRAFEMVAAFLRKQELIVLIPSITPPSLQFRTLYVRRVFSSAAMTGLNLWLYEWTIAEAGEITKGKFWWTFPKIFRYYDTNYSPLGDEKIPQWVSSAYADVADDGGGLLAPISATAQTMADAAATMADAAEQMRAAAGQPKQRKLF